MISFSHALRSVSVRKVMLLLLILSVFSGCAGADKERKNQKSGKRDNGEKQVHKSADYMLIPSDSDKFRSGRSKEEILKDVHWNGTFEAATEYKGNSITAISFGLFGRAFTHEACTMMAIFSNGKFLKFVRYPEWDGKKIKIGDYRQLIKAFESEPVTIAELKKEMKENPPPSSTDWGLTIAGLFLRKGVMEAEGRMEKAREKIYKKNTELRDQFNAARLKIGMTVNEVEKVLKAKPIQKGKVEAGTFKIYGSTESLDLGVDTTLHYPNILVVYQDGKVRGIYGIPGGEQGLELTRQKMFSDLPPRK